jgi:hypothetical protein
MTEVGIIALDPPPRVAAPGIFVEHVFEQVHCEVMGELFRSSEH